jgi:hypothetical protein
MPGQSLKRRDGLIGEQACNMNCCLWTRIETRRAYVVEKMDELENVRALTPFCLIASNVARLTRKCMCINVFSRSLKFLFESFHSNICRFTLQMSTAMIL